MNSRSRSFLYTFFISVLIAHVSLTAHSAESPMNKRLKLDDKSSLYSLKLKQEKPKRRANLRTLGSKTVKVGNNTTEQLSAVVVKAFSEQAKLAKSMQNIPQGRKIILARPQLSDEVLEFEHSYVIRRTTAVTVLDPSALSKESPQFKQFIEGRHMQAVSISELDSESRDGMAEFVKKELPSLRSDHPLRLAYESDGEQGLLQAITEGQGEFEVEDSLEIPKAPLQAKGNKLMFPTLKDGVFDFNNQRPMMKLSPVPFKANNTFNNITQLKPIFGLKAVEPKVISKVTGRHNFKEHFLAGVTVGNTWRWERKWKFPSGYFRITLGAGYGFGYRVPLVVTGQATPTEVMNVNVKDKQETFTTSVRMFPKDGNSDFYREVGLPESKIFDGKELVLEAYAGWGMKLKALWIKLVDKPYSEIGFDQSQNFRPVLGSAKNNLHIAIPPSLTRTTLDLGVLKGSATIGFKLEAEGTASLGFEQFIGTEKRNRQRITFNSSSPKNFTTTLPELQPTSSMTKVQKKFGFSVYDPEYQLGLEITPELKVDLRLGFKRISRRFSTGWIPLNNLKVDLGNIKLPTHAGTKRRYTYDGGRKTFEQIPAEIPEISTMLKTGGNEE